ncbi:LysR substrate-binding domain-containing protein [Paracoccus shanxieyensis]|uniref:LysR family transcriptional regulator n=1 Tax=Paracoccus shanxieyensis TaxID=2675752 RepID=A0A6L6J480_9RHOB|nr:LysR substrate-binding domain-containing protein [Paracoccus shanxieyensis]MTH65534.1 LysR family transcriptional regulator [Paracoccus shanxieyensis]MTH88670.1 LysR family transcriptional regulator [Paracoccus shanxieyensis]
MTLEQLRIFMAVASREHVTQAATALGLTQSAVSAALTALETRHGVRLFDRIGRRIQLTEDGRAFMAEAQAVLDRAETAEMLLADLSREPQGRLRIHASQTVASYWLPPRLMALHDLHPGIEFRLTLGNTRQVADAVAEGAADIGFVEGDVSHGDLHRQVVARDRLALVMADTHPLASEQSPDPAQWLDYRWALREPGSGTRAEFEAWLVQRGSSVAALDIAIELPSNEAVLSAVSHSQCLAALSQRAVASAAGAGWVRITPLPGAERVFSVLSDPRRHRTRAMQALLALAVAPEF